MYFAGVEGGSTNSRMVLLDQKGQILARSETGSTNHWQFGIDEVCSRIRQMLDDCKRTAGIEGRVEALGLGLSGLDTEETCARMLTAVSSLNLANHYHVCNDTVITLATATDQDGIAIISGTGSNCLLVKEDGSTIRSGGWGHMITRDGSAYSIAFEAIRTVIQHQEGIEPCDLNTDVVYKAILDHFSIKDRMDLLTYLYDKFDKAKIASLAKKIADGAEKGDELCRYFFKEAGKQLGRHVQAVIRCSKSTIPDPVTVVCTGAVFRSFEYLKAGFVEGVVPVFAGDVVIRAFRLVQLNDTAAVGAAYLAAKNSNQSIVHNYDKLSNVFFSHTF